MKVDLIVAIYNAEKWVGEIGQVKILLVKNGCRGMGKI